jgi:hypothetical protein
MLKANITNGNHTGLSMTVSDEAQLLADRSSLVAVLPEARTYNFSNSTLIDILPHYVSTCPTSQRADTINAPFMSPVCSVP